MSRIIYEEEGWFDGETERIKNSKMKAQLFKHAMALYDFCHYPAVRYKLLFSILDTPRQDPSLDVLREEFLKSDIVEEMSQLQDEHGGWGRLKSKDYSVKATRGGILDIFRVISTISITGLWIVQWKY